MNKHDKDKILVAAKILDDHLQNPPTIADLARQLAINQQKLKHHFKLVHQTTIRQYVVRRRLEIAKELLVHQPKLSISEISEQVGYNNAGYFARRFQERYGQLPHQLRNKLNLN